MNKKALFVLVPLVAMLSLLVTPAFAVPTYQSVDASGWGYVKTANGCFSGCATLEVVFGGVTAPITDTLNSGFVLLVVQGRTFEWVIDLSSVKVKCNVLTLCASPYALNDEGVTSSQVVTLPLSSITVVVSLCKPYCVAAFGCSAFFAGQGHLLTPD